MDVRRPLLAIVMLGWTRLSFTYLAKVVLVATWRYLLLLLPQLQSLYPCHPLREAEMGEISDGGGSDFARSRSILTRWRWGAEDLFFSSSSFAHSRDIGPGTGFGWDNSPIVSHTIKVMQGTPRLAPNFPQRRPSWRRSLVRATWCKVGSAAALVQTTP